MKANQAIWPIVTMARLLEVSASGKSLISFTVGRFAASCHSLVDPVRGWSDPGQNGIQDVHGNRP